jgi:hypothetical protein
MSTSASTQADGEHRDATDSESSSLDFPALTITAEGVAERRQQVGTCTVSCVETTPVQLAFSVTLPSQSHWKDLVDPTFRTHYTTVERGAFVDRLLEELDSGAVYERQSSGTTNAPQWDLTIEGSATEWKRLMWAFIVREERDDEDRAYQAVSYLEQLLASGLANAGAALAALALIDEYDVDRSTDSFRGYIDDIGGEED